MAKLVLISLVFLSNFATAKYHKMQDADYNKIWCDANHGDPEVTMVNADGVRLRADCVTNDFAVEVDSAEEWQTNLYQAQKYGRAFGKRALYVMVVEEPEQLRLASIAREFSIANKLNVEVEVLDRSTTTKVESLQQIGGPIVKLSRKDVCHVIGRGSYGATKHFKPFNSIQECEDTGGTLADNVGEAKLRKAEQDAIRSLGRTDF